MKHVVLMSALAVVLTLGFVWYASVPQSTDAAGIVTVTEADLNIWQISPDESFATAQTFVPGVYSHGQGSLFAGLITNTNYNNIPGNDPANDMFVAMLPLTNTNITNFDSFSFDYQLGNEDTVPGDVSVRITTGESADAFECAYLYEASLGEVDSFRKFVFSPQLAPAQVLSNGQGGVSCPATLDLISTSTMLTSISIQLGDTTSADTGAAVYIDGVESVIDGVSTYYDFEALPTTREECQKDGWKRFNLKNQGACMQMVNDGGKKN